MQEHACELFRRARQVKGRKDELWASMRVLLESVELPDWEVLWSLIGRRGARLVLEVPDTG